MGSARTAKRYKSIGSSQAASAILKASKVAGHQRRKSAGLQKKTSPRLTKASPPMNSDLVVVEKPSQFGLMSKVKKGDAEE